MSKKTGPLAFIQKLKERARAGDKLALAELQKLRALGAQYKRMAEVAAANSAAEEVVEGEEEDEEVLGEDDHFDGDKLEQADFIAKKHDNADGLVQKVKLREHGWKGLNDVAKFARINPPSVMQGSLGGYQVVRSDDIKPIQVANWGGEDEETLPITCTFMPVEQILVTGTPAGFVAPAPFGVVRWGTRAMLAEAIVDIGKGTQFTVNGSYCTLEVGVVTDNPAAPSGFATSMKLAGMLSFYTCVRTTPVTRTISFALPQNQTSAPILVPSFAKNVIVLTSNPTADVYRVIFQDSATNGLYSRDVAAGVGNQMLTPFPITTDVTTIAIAVGAVGAAGMQGRLLFELSL